MEAPILTILLFGTDIQSILTCSDGSPRIFYGIMLGVGQQGFATNGYWSKDRREEISFDKKVRIRSDIQLGKEKCDICSENFHTRTQLVQHQYDTHQITKYQRKKVKC